MRTLKVVVVLATAVLMRQGVAVDQETFAQEKEEKADEKPEAPDLRKKESRLTFALLVKLDAVSLVAAAPRCFRVKKGAFRC